MKELLRDLTLGRDELPLFTSCTSFEFPESEYILFTGEPKMVFEVVDEIAEGDDTPRFFRFVEHNNGESDYLVVADTLDEAWFEGKNVKDTTEHIENILDSLEGWYVSEVIDLDSYDE